MRRLLLLLVVALGLAPGTWLHASLAESRIDFRPILVVHALAVAEPRRGDFDISGVWQLTSHSTHFGGYSALAVLPGGQLFAVSDAGRLLRFAPPGTPPHPVYMDYMARLRVAGRIKPDMEGMARDPVSGNIWISFEGWNAILRHDSDYKAQVWIQPPAMRGWPANRGAESFARLADGRFIVLAEGSPRWFASTYPALLFPSDPVLGAPPIEFSFTPPRGFRPVDAVQVPDGRVLILLRRALWAFPPRFESLLMAADPAQIRAGEVWAAKEVFAIREPLPTENYEGLAVERGARGSMVIWLISDDNRLKLQRTLLMKLVWHPNEKARGTSRAPS
ncbi:MAG: esterase-like activity of phytase family protein [Croceibacterium sp.]